MQERSKKEWSEMEDKTRHKIKNLLMKMNDEDRICSKNWKGTSKW